MSRDVLYEANEVENTLGILFSGFDRRSLDAKLSIAITANFVNNHSAEEAEVRQISGIAKQFHQDFFKQMGQEIGIDLENIVYYRYELFVFNYARRTEGVQIRFYFLVVTLTIS